jgi:predicted small integral membrane protein
MELLNSCVPVVISVYHCIKRTDYTLTDIGQFNKVLQLTSKIITFPTKENTGTIFDRSINSLWFAKMITVIFIVMHAVSFILITCGVCYLIYHIKSDKDVFQKNKQICIFGLAITVCFYVCGLGLMSTDYFLSWMQKPTINFTLDLIGYSLPVTVSLFYLNLEK